MYYRVDYILVIFLIILIDYFGATRIARAKNKKKRKAYLIFGITLNLLLLGFFKYVNFLAGSAFDLANLPGADAKYDPVSILLPLGISFHTFQGLSYIIEVYKKKFTPEKNILTFSLYILFFPQLAAGPIERPQALLPQFEKKREFDSSLASSGLRLVLWGIFKKLIIADRIAVFINPIFAAPSSHNGIALLIAVFLFAYQIYCDFSGYTDMARGTARMFGINLVKNFYYPFASSSPVEFWNRWHISLYSWFRDYVYIPLGGNRVSGLLRVRNVLVVFAVSGLWHGAAWHFIAWGILNGIYVIISSQISSKFGKLKFFGKQFLTVIVTFTLIQLTWVFFRADSLSDASLILAKIAQSALNYKEYYREFLNGVYSVFSKEATLSQMLIMLFLIFFLEFVQFVARNTLLARNFQRLPIFIRWGTYYFLLVLIVSLGVDIPNITFIYFTF